LGVLHALSKEGMIEISNRCKLDVRGMSGPGATKLGVIIKTLQLSFIFLLSMVGVY